VRSDEVTETTDEANIATGGDRVQPSPADAVTSLDGVPPYDGAGRGTLTGPNRDLEARWEAARSFVVVGSACTIAGGLLAAVSRPTGFAAGVWVAAYLVLIAGVAQIALGAGQAMLAQPPPERKWTRGELAGWNLGGAAVVAGTLTGMPMLTTLGTAAVIVAIARFLFGVRTPRHTRHRWYLMEYRAVAVIVLISAPVGVALAWIRHG